MKYFATPLLCLAACGALVYAASTVGCGSTISVEDMATPPDMTAVTAYSCDQRQAVPPNCKEFSNFAPGTPESTFSALCSAQLSPTQCPRTDALGGCKSAAANYTFTTWFYPGTTFKTTADVQAYCTTSKTTFVAAQ